MRSWCFCLKEKTIAKTQNQVNTKWMSKLVVLLTVNKFDEKYFQGIYDMLQNTAIPNYSYIHGKTSAT